MGIYEELPAGEAQATKHGQAQGRHKNIWKQMTSKLCSKYIDHLQKVMPDVIRANGAPSGH